MLKNKSNSAKFWLEKINTAEHNYQPYFDLIDETRECYKLQRGGIFRAAKLSSACNIFWSSIETLKPFLYFKQPKPCIALMHQNPTDAEALACKILERALQWNLDHFDFDSVAKYARNDFLISGCGILWEVYKPKFATILDENGQEILLKTDEKVVSEYVDPKCFLADSDHVGIWEDVTWVARKHYLSRQNIFDVFGDKIVINNDFKNKIPGLVSIRIKGYNNQLFLKEAADILCASTGSACSNAKPSYVLKACGYSDEEIRETIRFSLSSYEDYEGFQELE